MRDKSTTIAKTLLLACIVILFPLRVQAQSKAGEMHNLDSLLSFASTDDIDWRFSSANISFEHLKLTNFVASNYALACYPYSGVDTIDIYVFVKHGAAWRIQTVHFALRPVNRELKIKESADRIEIFDGSRQLLSVLAFKPNRQ